MRKGEREKRPCCVASCPESVVKITNQAPDRSFEDLGDVEQARPSPPPSIINPASIRVQSCRGSLTKLGRGQGVLAAPWEHRPVAKSLVARFGHFGLVSRNPRRALPLCSRLSLCRLQPSPTIVDHSCWRSTGILRTLRCSVCPLPPRQRFFSDGRLAVPSTVQSPVGRLFQRRRTLAGTPVVSPSRVQLKRTPQLRQTKRFLPIKCASPLRLGSDHEQHPPTAFQLSCQICASQMTFSSFLPYSLPLPLSRR